MSINAIRSRADAFSPLASFIVKLGLFFGSASLVTYLMRIDHLPREFSIGDGLLLFVVAASTGVVYALFTVSLVSLGVVIVAPFRNLIAALIGLINRKMGEGLKLKLARFDWSAAPFAVVAALFVLAASRENKTAIWQLPVIAVVMYFLYSVLIFAQKERTRLAAERSSPLAESLYSPSTKGPIEVMHERNIGLSILFLAAAPLVAGVATGTLLDGSMRLAQIRVDGATIHVKDPHHALFPPTFSATSVYTPAGFKTFEGVDVLFRGFGTTVVVALPEGDTQRIVEVPSEALLFDHSRSAGIR